MKTAIVTASHPDDIEFMMARRKASKHFKYTEGWRSHLHYGFCGSDDDPLKELDNDCIINEAYKQSLDLF